MNFNLYSIHDEIIYNATIKNKGTIPVEIVDIMESPNYKIDKYKKMISPVTITISDIKGKVLNPKESINLKIIVYYNPGENNSSKSIDYKIGLITKSK